MSVLMDKRIELPLWRRPPAMAAGAAIGGLMILALAVAAIGGAARNSLRVPAAQLSIEPVRQDVFHDFTAIQGQVEPHDTLYIDALEGGQVRQILAQAGDRVVAGQPLVVFRNTDVELDVLNREAIVAQSLSQAHTLQNGLEATRAANEKALQQIDYDIVRLQRASRRRDVYANKGVFPQEEIDQLHDELDHNLKIRPVQAETNRRQEALRRAELPQIQAELATLQRSLGAIRSRLEDLTVKAPAAGRITVMDLKLGQTERPGDRLAEIVPDTGFKVTADIDEFYLPRIRVGQIATGEFDGQSRRLRVTRIYPQVKNGVFTVDMEFVGAAPSGLTAGATVQGKLSLGDDRKALVLPAGAFLERTGGDWVFVLSPDGRHADRRRIKLGRRNAEQVEVVSGLRPGERVVTSDYTGFEKIDRLDITR
jgi:HlyD family secretion protein